MRKHEYLYALNAGEVDPDALGRIDLEKMRLAATTYINLLPRVLGPATLRPGTRTIAQINAGTSLRAMQRGIGSTYILLLDANTMRVVSNDAIVQTPNRTATVAQSAAWVDQSVAPATASTGVFWQGLTSSTYQQARVRQQVTITETGTPHIVAFRVGTQSGIGGNAYVSIGTSAGGGEVLAPSLLRPGWHKIQITPATSPIHIDMWSSGGTYAQIHCSFDHQILGGGGEFSIPTRWSSTDIIGRLRFARSKDTLFVGDGTIIPHRIEHRGASSWGVAEYHSRSGPWVEGDPGITMSITGTSITASQAFFNTGHVNSLIELTQTGKSFTQTLNGADQSTDYVTVTGVGDVRLFRREAVATGFTGTLVLERSFDAADPVVWEVYQSFVNGAATVSALNINDGQNNITVHYRWRISAFTAGSISASLNYASSVSTGVGRISSYTSPTSVGIAVIQPFGATTATRQWRVGEWNSTAGWPRVPQIHDSRLYWLRDDYVFASVVNDLDSFDDTVEGDSGPIFRSIPEDSGLWAISQQRLLIGSDFAEMVVQASDIDQAITPTAWTVRAPSKRGCANVEAVEHDDGIFFLQRSTRRVYEMSTAADVTKYSSNELSRLNPAAFASGVVKMAVQQQPDTRLYCVLTNGSCIVITFERDDKVVAVSRIELADGLIRDVAVIKRSSQDDVYFKVQRNNGTYWLERLMREGDQLAVATCTTLDHSKELTGTISAISGGSHLAGRTVQVYANGAKRASVTLDGSGNASLGGTYSRVVYGLTYMAKFQSVKLAYAAGLGTAIGETKIIKGIGLLLSNTALDGVKFGSSSSNIEALPPYLPSGAARTAGLFVATYDPETAVFPGDWQTDPRVYVQHDSSEGPFTLQSIKIDIETRDGSSPQGG